MIATIVIAVLVLLYAVWVIRKLRRDKKAGKLCNCGCMSCTADCAAKKKDA